MKNFFKKNLKTVILFLVISIYLLPILVFAADPAIIVPGQPAAPQALSNPLGDTVDPRILIGKIIGAVLGIIGSIALAIFIYGGFTWMTSAGSPEKVRKGRDMIIWAVMGLAIIFLSYAIVYFVIGAFTGG